MRCPRSTGSASNASAWSPEDQLIEEHRGRPKRSRNGSKSSAPRILLAGDHDLAVGGEERSPPTRRAPPACISPYGADAVDQVAATEVEDLEVAEVVGDPLGQPLVLRPGPDARDRVEHHAGVVGRSRGRSTTCASAAARGSTTSVPSSRSRTNRVRPLANSRTSGVGIAVVVAEVDAAGNDPQATSSIGERRPLRPLLVGHEVGVELPQVVDRGSSLVGVGCGPCTRARCRSGALQSIDSRRPLSAATPSADLDRHPPVGEQTDVGLERTMLTGLGCEQHLG